MKFGRAASVVLLVGLCALMASGCSTRKGKTSTTGFDNVPLTDVDQLAGDKALGGERFETGERIADVDLESVLFDYDSFQVRDSEVTKVQAAADYMKANAGVRLIVEGHCDERGSREYNVALGEHRALAVRAQLIGLGVEGSRIQTRSFGEEQPADPAHTPDAWSANRRGAFALYR